jgi:hypothetical protein
MDPQSSRTEHSRAVICQPNKGQTSARIVDILYRDLPDVLDIIFQSCVPHECTPVPTASLSRGAGALRGWRFNLVGV